MADVTNTESKNNSSILPLTRKDLLYCFAIILLMLTAFDLMGNFIFLGISFGLSYTEADIPILNLILNLGAQLGVIFTFIILYQLRKIEPEEKTTPEGLHVITTYALYALNLAFSFFVVINISTFLEGLGLSTESPYEGIEPTLALLENPLFIILFFSVLVIGAAVSEELVFRRALIPMLERRGLGQAWALIISSIVFSLRHTPSDYLSGSLGFTIVHFFGTMSGGLILGYLYLRTRNVIWPILLHGLTNGVAAVAQVITTIYDIEDIVDSIPMPLMVYSLFILFTVGFGVVVISYLILQAVSKRYDMNKPVWLQIITDIKRRTVSLGNILLLTIILIFFSGGIPFIFEIFENFIRSTQILSSDDTVLFMIFFETGYYLVFLLLLCFFIFNVAKPMIKPIFVSTVISDHSGYSPTPAFIRRPTYQPASSGKLCHNCGNAIIPNAKFCAFCGANHNVDEEDLTSPKMDI